MTEKELKILAQAEVISQYGLLVIWFAPKYKILSWDIFSIFDMICLTPYGNILFFQITTSPNLSARRKKVYEYLRKNNILRVSNMWLLSYNKSNSKWKHESIIL